MQGISFIEEEQVIEMILKRLELREQERKPDRHQKRMRNQRLLNTIPTKRIPRSPYLIIISIMETPSIQKSAPTDF